MKELFAWLEAAILSIFPEKVVLSGDENDADCEEGESVVGTLTDEELRLVGVLQSIDEKAEEGQRVHDALHETEGYDGSACEEHHRLRSELNTKKGFVKTVLFTTIEHRLGYPLNEKIRIRKDHSIIMKKEESLPEMLSSLIIGLHKR